MKKALNLLALIMISALVACTTKPKSAEETREPASNEFAGYAWATLYDISSSTDPKTGAVTSRGDLMRQSAQRIRAGKFDNLHELGRYSKRICDIEFVTNINRGNDVLLYYCAYRYVETPGPNGYPNRTPVGYLNERERQSAIQYLRVTFPDSQTAQEFKRNLESKAYNTIGIPTDLKQDHYFPDWILSTDLIIGPTEK